MRENLANYEEISFKSLLFIFKKNNILITLIILAIALFLGNLYYKKQLPMYKSYISIELPERNPVNRPANGLQNIINTITMPTPMDVETEIDIIKSKKIISKTINIVPMNVRYYIKTPLKEKELFNPPFLVKNVKLKDIKKIKFEMIPLDENSFKLKIASKDSKFFKYNYGQKIEFTKGSFVIKKNSKHIPKKQYIISLKNKQKVIKDIQKRMSVTPSSLRSSLIVVEYKDSNPVILQKFLNTLGKVYIEENIKKRTQSASSTLDFINDQLKKVKKKLEKSALILKNFKKRNEIIDIQTKTRELIDAAVRAKEELDRIQIDLRAFQTIKKEVNKGNFSALAGLQVRYPVLDDLLQQLNRARIQKETLLTEYTPLHPNVKRVQNDIKEIIRSIKNVLAGIEGDLNQRKETLKRRVAELNAKIKALPSKEQTFANLQRDYEVNERLYSYLLQEKSQFSIAKAARVADTKIIDYAEKPLEPYSPKKGLIMGVSGFFGLLLAMMIVYIKEKSDPKIRSLKDIYKISSIPIFATVPFIKNKDIYNKPFVLEDKNSLESEAFRKLRAEIEFVETPGRSKTILVTSFIPNERKSSVSTNLASIFAIGGKKTLLVSFDFITPQIHKKLSIPNFAGTIDILQGLKLKELPYRHKDYPNFHIIPTGSVQKEFTDLLQSKYMKKFFEYVKLKYDFIVVDTSPIELNPDTLILTRYADITLFSIRIDYSEKDNIKTLEEYVKKYKIKNPGFVVNGVKIKEMGVKKYDQNYIYYATH
ncbi:MAG: AAA family ATPase [Epsilonproteobacteria bacterium]|nr:AAA family ATPase [Campylobacterota bacterium]